MPLRLAISKNIKQKRDGNMHEELINMPRTKRGRATLNNILSAAAQVFYEKGYHAASINDITRLAGVASGTFYTYFDSKYDLYKFLLLQCSHMIRKNLSKCIKKCKNRLEAEQEGMRAWLEFAMENQYMYHIIWESMYVDYSLFEDYYVTFQQAYKKGLDEAKKAGEIREDIDTEVLAYTLMGASNFLGLNWCLFKHDPSAVNHVTEQFMKIIKGEAFIQGAKPEEVPKDAGAPASKPKFRFNVTVDEPDGNE